MNFIYALNEKDKEELLSKGFNLINKQNINNESVYVFENDKNHMSTFSKKDKGRFLFSNKMFF